MSESLTRQKQLITAYQCIDKLEGFEDEVAGHILNARRELKLALGKNIIQMSEVAKVELRQLDLPFPEVVVDAVIVDVACESLVEVSNG